MGFVDGCILDKDLTKYTAQNAILFKNLPEV